MRASLTVVALGVVLEVLGACSRGAERVRGAPPDTAAAASTPQTASPPSTGPTASGRTYVGLRYQTLPAGVTYQAGALITSGRGTPTKLDFALVQTPAGPMIWLDSAASAVSGSGTPSGTNTAKIVRAALAIPPLARDERVFLSTCDVNGVLDPLVVAIVVNEPNATRFTKVRQVWRANAGAALFDVIPVTNVVCEDA